MTRIAKVELDQINRQIDKIDSHESRLSDLEAKLNIIAQQSAVSDPEHAPPSTNNVNFTWTGGSTSLSWAQGFIKKKNWRAQTTVTPPIKSSAPGSQHFHAVAAGSLTLAASTYYWLGWDPVHQKMIASTDASVLHGNNNVHVLCQVFTGTAGQTGSAGGGGSQGGVDLSGVRYKNF